MDYSSNTNLLVYLSLILYLPSTTAIEALSSPEPTTISTGQWIIFNCTADEPADETNIIEWYIHWDSYSLLKANAQRTAMLTDDVYGPSGGRGNYFTEYEVVTRPDGSKIHICTLEITDATLLDTGYFGCTHRVDPNNNFRTLLAEKVKLTVVKLPDSGFPQCEKGDDSTGFITLTCTSMGGEPPASLVWYNGTDMISPVKNNTVVYYKPGEEAVRQYSCLATHPGWQQPKACAIMFDLSSTTTVTTESLLTTTPSVIITTEIAVNATNLRQREGANNDSITTDFNTISTTPLIGIKSTPPNYLIPIIIGASSVALFIILLFIILLSLVCRRRRKRKKRPLIFLQESVAPAADEQELPTLESAPQPASENPYAELGQIPVEKPVSDNHDYDDAILKPWKYNQEILDSITAEDNAGFEGDNNNVDNQDDSGGYEETSGATGYTPPSSTGYTPPPSEGGEVKIQEYGLGNIYATRL